MFVEDCQNFTMTVTATSNTNDSVTESASLVVRPLDEIANLTMSSTSDYGMSSTIHIIYG